MRSFFVFCTLFILFESLAQNSGSYVILRKSFPQEANPNGRCYEFLLVNTASSNGRNMVTVNTLTNTPTVNDFARNQGYELDPLSHPPGSSWPYASYSAADYIVSLLSPYGQDAYGCLRSPRPELVPVRTEVGTGNSVRGWVILRKPDLYQPVDGPPICFQFHLEDLSKTQKQMATIDISGQVIITEYAARQGYEIDPFAENPYSNQEAADAFLSQLSRFGGDFYGCLRKCPANSELRYNPNDPYNQSGYDCYCLPGHRWNESRTACLPIQCPPNSHLQQVSYGDGYDCFCDPGYRWNQERTQCVEFRCPPNSQLMYDQVNGFYDCFCIQGYQWNEARTECIPVGGNLVNSQNLDQQKKELLDYVTALGDKWQNHWCTPMWSGCGITPKGIRDGILHQVEVAPDMNRIHEIRTYIACIDPIMMDRLEESVFWKKIDACKAKYHM